MLLASCEDFIEIDPPDTSLVQETVFSSDQDAASAISGMYIDLERSFVYSSNGGLLIHTGRYSDIYLNFSDDEDEVEFGESELIPSNGDVSGAWRDLYSSIYSTNVIIEGIQSGQIKDSLAAQYEAEARFLRAYNYFHLVNLWGDVPLTTTSDYRVNATLARSPESLVYDQITQDLRFAIESLPQEYYSINGLRSRPIGLTAQAFLSKVYLFNNNWTEAESAATAVIKSNLFALESDLSNVFSPSSLETIWHLQNTQEFFPTYEGVVLILTFTPPSDVSLRSDLIQEFDPSDLRLANWIGSISSGTDMFYHPFKYKVRLAGGEPAELQSQIRLAEIHLIRAEARAQQGNLSGALEDLNVVRSRAGLLNSLATTQQQVLDSIYQERKLELFSEGGNRWFDLKRTGRANGVLQSIKPNWRETAVLWPIPEAEFANNSNIGSQNPGY